MRIVLLLTASLSVAHAGELHEAARACDAGRMQQLLSRRPQLNERDKDGKTPLHIAIDSRKLTCVHLLLKAGADRVARDREGRTAFSAADEIADQHDREVIHTVLLGNRGQNKYFQDPSQPAPWSLEYSVTHGQSSLTKMLLELGVDPNMPGTDGSAPLAHAALKGDIESVRLLLNAGAKPNAVSPEGTQPIHDAALGDNAEVIRELVAREADVDARTRDETQTPLHIAAAMGKLKAVEALVALGANLTVKDSQGRTPLDAAEGLPEVAAVLRRATPAK